MRDWKEGELRACWGGGGGNARGRSGGIGVASLAVAGLRGVGEERRRREATTEDVLVIRLLMFHCLSILTSHRSLKISLMSVQWGHIQRSSGSSNWGVAWGSSESSCERCVSDEQSESRKGSISG